MGFPAKLLLFGEYTVLSGSQALARPLFHLRGKWVRTGHPSGLFDRPEFLRHVISLAETMPVFTGQGIRHLESDIANGYDYVSDIPMGYGLGSSGALCACIYRKYFAAQTLPISEIRVHLAALEGFFHGRSSGMDPLVSYLGTPVLRDGDSCQSVSLDQTGPAWLSTGLLDSGIGRNTAALVSAYKSLTANASFHRGALQTLISLVNETIHCFILGQWQLVFEHVRLISVIQYQAFSPMIPQRIKGIWERSLETRDTAIKLCGAGGGGFFLVFSKYPAEAEQLLKPFPVSWLEG